MKKRDKQEETYVSVQVRYDAEIKISYFGPAPISLGLIIWPNYWTCGLMNLRPIEPSIFRTAIGTGL